MAMWCTNHHKSHAATCKRKKWRALCMHSTWSAAQDQHKRRYYNYIIYVCGRTISSARMPLRWLLYRDTIHCRPTIWYSRSVAPGGGTSVFGASWMTSPTLCARLHGEGMWG